MTAGIFTNFIQDSVPIDRDWLLMEATGLDFWNFNKLQVSLLMGITQWATGQINNILSPLIWYTTRDNGNSFQ